MAKCFIFIVRFIVVGFFLNAFPIHLLVFVGMQHKEEEKRQDAGSDRHRLRLR